MDISARMRQILLALLHENGPISVKLLAEQIGVSKRTVQRELEYMERTLKGYEVRFTSKTGVGVWLEGGEEEKKRLLAEISRGDSYDVSNREDRRKRLVLEILKEKGLKKLYYYSSQFGVSEATVSADLESVESWLGQFGLQISRKPGSGIETNGSEEDYRRAIRAFIEENINTNILREAYEEDIRKAEQQAAAPAGETCSESSAYNKASKYDAGTDTYVDWDANWDEGLDAPRSADGGYVIADPTGPGSIVRIWSADPRQGHIKVFIDGGEVPEIDMPFIDLFGTGPAPFDLPELCYEAGRGKNC